MTDTATGPHAAFTTAEHLAPTPATFRDATPEAWIRHYAALALAAHAAFRDATHNLPRNPQPGSRPDIGYLITLAVSATAAAVALSATDRHGAARTLWEVTPECGNLNGEDLDWLAETCDLHGVNPADLYRWYEARDFTSPSITAPSLS